MNFNDIYEYLTNKAWKIKTTQKNHKKKNTKKPFEFVKNFALSMIALIKHMMVYIIK